MALALAAACAACTAGPDYTRPDVDLPADYGTAQSPVPAPERWWTVFQDPLLERLVDEALAANGDLRIAAERIAQSRAQLGIARADQGPDAGVQYERARTRSSERGAMPLPPGAVEANRHRLGLTASWELDFWGKYRRATEAARAELAASQAGRDAVRASLVADVARGYFALRALDRRLESVVRTGEGRAKALELQKLRLDAGVVSELDYRQVEADLRATEALVPAIRQQRVAQEGALALLLGRGPREVLAAGIARGEPAAPEVEVPAGLPSDLLLRRADLRQAEERLRAANARIGVARAAFFPSISLTGFFGAESHSLGDLFSGPARSWSLAGGVLQPLLESQRIRGGVDL